MQIIVFEDDLVSRLYPVTVGRPAYAMTCGSFRLVDWLVELAESVRAPLRGIVRPHLATIQHVDYPQLSAIAANGNLPALVVNARMVPTVSAFKSLQAMIGSGQPGAVLQGASLAAALIAEPSPAPPAHADSPRLQEYLQHLVLHRLPVLDYRLPLIDYPHDLVRYNLQIIGESLEYRLTSGRYSEIRPGVFAADGATLGDYTVTDTTKGPVVLDEYASVGPHSFLRGPAYLGPKSRVIEHSAIKDAVSLGHTTKIGGEVEASVIEPYTNKQHHGFLGHSYLGSWINLGAGTCNSDLKNTYGNVKMDYRGESVSTGMQFVGCMMGDYAKSAINTGIFTGKTIGVCSMVYGFVTTNVPSFVNYARLFGQVTELPAEIMVATQQRMFARRSVNQRPCDAQLIHDMYELTRHERQLAGEPLQL
jgi:UDP-N-acetylglucosamine diphosphorylase / glucose-1-phosphate thymidylyltransferase / UDP-N-acetylgalactosamine diphosphorylase / glucosamine-1-phosphate N-acetyltransferase / galactosamine-1-phosphate N-acetyltransferase